jgi:hypothetical protein
MTVSILWAIVLLCVLACAGYVAFSKWFDKRHPIAASERAQADADDLLYQANQETVKRPRVRAGS